MFEVIRRKASSIAVGALSLFAAAQSFAVDGTATGAFDQAVSSAGTDVAHYGAAMVGLAIIGVSFGIGIKYVKKLRGAS
jgi:hypothetical protein